MHDWRGPSCSRVNAFSARPSDASSPNGDSARWERARGLAAHANGLLRASRNNESSATTSCMNDRCHFPFVRNERAQPEAGLDNRGFISLVKRCCSVRRARSTRLPSVDAKASSH
ncbi:hypothetical protein MRX96_047098 [Rhipicephalus microplus]